MGEINWIIGTGPMAISYCKVLQEQFTNFLVVGRNELSCRNFTNETGFKAFSGGVKKIIEKKSPPINAIVAVGSADLYSVCKLLLKAGVRNILLEKPGALEIENLKKLNDYADKNSSRIWIAYNRRFYSSVRTLRKIINCEKDIKSISFDFTERIKRIKPSHYSKEVMNKWILSNSSHVIDLAFHLIGTPNISEISCYQLGGISWHNSGSNFVGAGISNLNIPFNYRSDWHSPGGWSLDIYTEGDIYKLKPLEKLLIYSKEASRFVEIRFDKKLDLKYKPGLFLQCQKFFSCNFTDMCSINEQIKNFPIYSKMAGY